MAGINPEPLWLICTDGQSPYFGAFSGHYRAAYSNNALFGWFLPRLREFCPLIS
jgi:hypothetical protein